MVSRNLFGIWYGRTGPFKILTSDNAEVRVWNSGVEDCQKNHEDCPAEVKRMINYLAEAQWKNKRPMLAGKQIVLHFFYTVNKTQGHTEWCTWPWFVWRQSQDVQSGWEENMTSPWSWFGCTCLGERVWATSETFTTHEACDDLKSAEHFWKRNREATNDLGLWLIAFSNSISRQQHTLQQRLKNKAHIVDLGCQKGSCTVYSGMTWQRKGIAKRIDQEAQSRKKTIQQNDNVSERQEDRIRLEKTVFSVFQLHNRNSLSRPRVWLLASTRIANTSRKIIAKWERIARLETRKRRIDLLNIRVWMEVNKTNSHIWTWSRRAAKTEDLQMHHRMTKKPQSGRRSKKILQSTEIPTSQRGLQDKRTLHRCQQNKLFRKLRHHKKVKNTATGLAMHSKERTYIVDSGASLHVMVFLLRIIERRRLFDVQAQFWIFRPPMALLSHTRQRKSTSRSLALAHGYIWWKILVGTVVGKTLQWSSWPIGRELPDSQKVKKDIECNVEKLRPRVAVPQYHPVNVREMEDTMIRHNHLHTG